MATLFSAARGQKASLHSVGSRTVDGQVAQRRACRPLDLDVRVLQEEQDGLQCVSIDLSHICGTLAGEPAGFRDGCRYLAR